MPQLSPARPDTSERKIILLTPRGFCAGVVRAIDVVKIALDLYGAPIYVRKEIVHNRHVVEELKEAGAIFVKNSPKHLVEPALFSVRMVLLQQ